LTKSFTGRDGQVEQLHAVHVEFEGRNMREVPGSEFTINATLFFWQWVSSALKRNGMLGQLGVNINERGNVATDTEKNDQHPGIFAAGDMSRGQSLVVWAIREGV